MLKLESLIVETINEVIRNIFDDDIARILLSYFDEDNSLTIDDKLRNFEEDLPKILGSGAVIIEDLILETLYSKLGIKLEQKRKSFTEYITDLIICRSESR